MDLAALRDRVAKLVPYQRRLRPPNAESLPAHIDAELRRIDTSSRDIVQVLQDLNERLTVLGG
jgi:hypothetical protein